MAYSPEHLHAILTRLPRPRRYVVAFSGGMDSTALLHAMACLRGQLTAPLSAVHIDHGLHAGSASWSIQCERVCQRQAIPVELIRVDATPLADESPEAAARRARYTALAERIGRDEMLLTAHHQADQAETVLIQLMRGAGPHGLAAMPRTKPFAGGWLSRPLLGFAREELHTYAEAQGLTWIDDPSNFDTGFERNFLRHELLPLVRERHPALDKVLARSAQHFAEAAELLDSIARVDLALVVEDPDARVLRVAQLLALEPARCRNVLRYWLRSLNLPLPDSVHLHRVVDECLNAAPDATPLVAWAGVEIRRYRNQLHAMSPLVSMAGGFVQVLQANTELHLPGDLGVLSVEWHADGGIPVRLFEQGRVRVRFRRGGERCRPLGRGHRHSVKKLFQEGSVPTWRRSRWPLIYLDDEIVQIPGICSGETDTLKWDESGYRVIWHQTGIEKNR